MLKMKSIEQSTGSIKKFSLADDEESARGGGPQNLASLDHLSQRSNNDAYSGANFASVDRIKTN